MQQQVQQRRCTIQRGTGNHDRTSIVLQFAPKLPEQGGSSSALPSRQQARPQTSAKRPHQTRLDLTDRLRTKKVPRTVATLKKRPMQLKMRLVHTASVLCSPPCRQFPPIQRAPFFPQSDR
jgi:hypothetical protein